MLNKILPFLVIIGFAGGYLLGLRGDKFQPKGTEEKAITQDNQKLFTLSVWDSALTRQIRNLKDSVKYHKKEVAYWMAKYSQPIKPTKEQIGFVFESDSSTIAKEVIKGGICDSLQRTQAKEINSLSQEVVKFDSLVKVKNESIKYSLKMDSTRQVIVKKLQRKVTNRTVGEIGLGILALLVIIFHR